MGDLTRAVSDDGGDISYGALDLSGLAGVVIIKLFNLWNITT